MAQQIGGRFRGADQRRRRRLVQRRSVQRLIQAANAAASCAVNRAHASFCHRGFLDGIEHRLWPDQLLHFLDILLLCSRHFHPRCHF